MKEIKAIIQPGKLGKVREALTALPDFPGMSVCRVEGCGPSRDRAAREGGLRLWLTDFSAKVRLEIVAADELVDPIVAILRSVAHTGQDGDGVIWVTPVEQFSRIKTTGSDEIRS